MDCKMEFKMFHSLALISYDPGGKFLRFVTPVPYSYPKLLENVED